MGALPAAASAPGSTQLPPTPALRSSSNLHGWLRARLADIFSFEGALCFFMFSAFIGDSPFLPFIPYKLALSFSISVFAGVVLLLRGKMRRDADAGTLMFLMLSFICWIMLSTLWSPSINYSNISLMRLLGLSAWCFTATVLFISGDPQRQRRLFAGIAIIGGYLAWETVLFYRGLAAGGGSGFLRPLDIDYLSLARAVGSAALITMYYALYEQRWPRLVRAACGLASAVLHVLVLMIGARSSLIATLLCGLIIWLPLLRPGRTPWALLRQLLIAIFAAGLLYAGAGKLLGGRNVEDSLTGVRRILYILDAGFASNDRYIRYVTTWRELERSPLLGSGVGSWPVLTGYGDVQAYPHNIWLDVWFELGLPGLLIITTMFWWGLRRYWPPGGWLQRPYAPLILALFGTSFINVQLSGNYNDNWYMYALLGALLLQPLRPRRTEAYSPGSTCLARGGDSKPLCG